MCKIVIWPHQKPDCIKMYVVAASSHWSHRDCSDYRGYREGAAQKIYKAPRVFIFMGVPERGAWKFRVPSLASAFGRSHQKPDRIKIYVVAAKCNIVAS